MHLFYGPRFAIRDFIPGLCVLAAQKHKPELHRNRPKHSKQRCCRVTGHLQGGTVPSVLIPTCTLCTLIQFNEADTLYEEKC